MKINVVLYHPEIPQNTGNIMRSCVGFNAKLHLIKPLGFSLDEKHLKRSAVDYYQYINYEVYEDFDDSEIEPTKFLVDFDEETTKNHTVNIKDMLTQEIEEIDIDEIYPYVMKKMFAFSKCNNCSEV